MHLINKNKHLEFIKHFTELLVIDHRVIIYFPQLSYLAASSAEIGGFFKLSSIEAATSGWMTFPIGLKPIPAPAEWRKKEWWNE